MKTAEYTADNCQEQTHTRPVADSLPLDRELKVVESPRLAWSSSVADSLPLDRELKVIPLATKLQGEMVADSLPLDRELKVYSLLTLRPDQRGLQTHSR